MPPAPQRRARRWRCRCSPRRPNLLDRRQTSSARFSMASLASAHHTAEARKRTTPKNRTGHEGALVGAIGFRTSATELPITMRAPTHQSLASRVRSARRVGRSRPAERATEREVACRRGGPGRRIGEKAGHPLLDLSALTVKHHLANARSKVGATTTAQLVWNLGPTAAEPEARDGVTCPRFEARVRRSIPARSTSARSASCRNVATDSAIDDVTTVPTLAPRVTRSSSSCSTSSHRIRRPGAGAVSQSFLRGITLVTTSNVTQRETGRLHDKLEWQRRCARRSAY